MAETTDLSASIAKMLIEGEGLQAGMKPPEMVDCILDRWPEARADQIHRGFLIAIETASLDDAMGDPR